MPLNHETIEKVKTMNHETIEKIKRIMSPFSSGRMIDCSNILKLAVVNEISTSQLIAYGQVCRDLVPKTDFSLSQSAPLRQCPECKTRTRLRLISAPQGPLNLYGYRSCWECPACGWEKYSCLCYNSELKSLESF